MKKSPFEMTFQIIGHNLHIRQAMQVSRLVYSLIIFSNPSIPPIGVE